MRKGTTLAYTNCFVLLIHCSTTRAIIMYRFIFYFIYKGQLNQKDGGPLVGRIVASMTVFGFLLLHILFLYSITRFVLSNYYNTNISFSMGKTYNNRLIFFLPIFIAVSFIIYNYFNKTRIIEITNQYENIHIYSFSNFLKFFGVFILPLLASIFLINHSIS